jgi:hypothetical protein
MIKNKIGLKGKVTAIVYTRDGEIKRFPQNWFQRLFGLKGNQMIVVNHNIVTDQGDALIADLMATTPARQKLDNTNGRMTVGTGWTGTTPKTNTACNTPTGSAEALDATYPVLKGAFSAANDNVIIYKSTFEAGDLNATSPAIDEVALHNTTVDNLAYAQITPEIPVASSDTLAITWEITLLGA